MWECHKYLLDQRHHITYKILSNLSITLKRPARLRLRTLWRYTNDDVIIIIIISVKKLGSAYIFQIVVFREYFGLHTWQLYTVTYSSA